MSIDYRCEYCSKKLKLPEKAIGKRVKCPHCAAVLLIPEDYSQSPVPEKTQPSPQSPVKAAPQKTATPEEKIVFDCFSCGKVLKAPASTAGKKVKCPKCECVQIVPRSTHVQPPSSPKPKSPASPSRVSTAKKPVSRTEELPPLSFSDPVDPLADLTEGLFAPAPLDSKDPFSDILGDSYALAPTSPSPVSPMREPAIPSGFSPSPAAEDPFAGLLDPITPAGNPLETHNPYQSPTLTKSEAKTRPLNQKRTGRLYAPIGEVLSGTFKVFFGNFNQFLSLGGLTVLVSMGFGLLYLVGAFAFGFVLGLTLLKGRGLEAVPYFQYLVFFILSPIALSFYTALYLGNHKAALDISGGKTRQGLFSFSSDHYIRSFGYNMLLFLCASILAYAFMGLFSVRSGAIHHIPEGENTAVASQSVYEPGTLHVSQNRSGFGFEVGSASDDDSSSGFGSWDTKEESFEEDFFDRTQPSSNFRPRSTPSGNPQRDVHEFPQSRFDPQEQSFEIQTSFDSSNHGFSQSGYPLFEELYRSLLILLSIITLWANFYILDRDEKAIPAMLKSVPFFFVNILSFLLFIVVFVFLPIAAAGGVCFLGFRTGPGVGIFCAAVSGLLALIFFLPLSSCFLAVVYRLATYGDVATTTAKKSGGYSTDW